MGIVNGVILDHVGTDETAELQQVAPIAAVPHEARRIDAEHLAYGTFADPTNGVAEARAIHHAARRPAKIGVEDADTSESVPVSKVDQLVLSPRLSRSSWTCAPVD